jgi:hypothetical protein
MVFVMLAVVLRIDSETKAAGVVAGRGAKA